MTGTAPSPGTKYQTPYPTCPRCKRPLVQLRGYDARNATVGVADYESDGYADPVDAYYDERYGWGIFQPIVDWLKGYFQWLWAGRVVQKRLDRVVRDYPNSLYCPACGYIDRRR